MANRDTIQSKSSSGYRSLRNPQNVWVIRAVGLVLVLFALNVSTVNDSQNAREWADGWLAVNQLQNKVISTKNQSKILFASNTNPTIVDSEYQIEKPPSMAKAIQINYSNKSIAIRNSATTKNVDLEEFITVTSKEIRTIPENTHVEVIEALIVDYERRLSQEYAETHNSGNFLLDNRVHSVKWLVGGSIGPQFSNETISQPSGQSYAQASNVNNITSYSQGTDRNTVNQSFSAMLNFGLNLGNHFEVIAGVNISQMGGAHSMYYDSEVEQTQVILTVKPSNGTSGSRDLEVVEEEITYYNYISDTLKANYRFTTLEIPLLVKYNFGKRKLSYNISSGFSTTIGSAYSAQFQSTALGEGDLSEERYGVNSVNLLIGFGIQYSASSNVVIKLAPGYKYGIPVSSKPTSQTPISSLGVFTGLNYYF